MSGFVISVGNPDRHIVTDMLNKIMHRGCHFSGIWEGDSLVMAQNYLKADIDMTKIVDKIPVACEGGMRLCYDGQLGNTMSEPAVNRQGFAEEIFLMGLCLEKGLQMFPFLNDAIFAFAISDGRRMLIARDLLGIKPLFYGHKSGTMYVASELKSLTAHMEDVHEFPPGHYMDESANLSKYAELPSQLPFDVVTNPDQSMQEIRRIISQNIRTRVSFKRPTAALLSGGMDSSVVCLMAAEHLRDKKGTDARLKTYSVGLGESQDIVNARLLARTIDSIHKEVIVTPQQVVETLPKVIYYLESFDPSLVRSSTTNYLVSQAAMEDGVEVLLSGEGADELFCGYAYLKQFPLANLFQGQMECLGFLHNNASLRLDRMNQAHSIKVVAPLLSGDLLEYTLRIPAYYKQKPHKDNSGLVERTEKWILRKAFEPELPQEITWRAKQEFSQGSGSATLLASFFEDQIESRELDDARRDFPFLHSKEELFYFRIFTEHFGQGRAVDTVGQWVYE